LQGEPVVKVVLGDPAGRSSDRAQRREHAPGYQPAEPAERTAISASANPGSISTWCRSPARWYTTAPASVCSATPVASACWPAATTAEGEWSRTTITARSATPGGGSGRRAAPARRSGSRGGCPPQLPRNRACAVRTRLFGTAGYEPRRRPVSVTLIYPHSVNCGATCIGATMGLRCLRSCISISDWSPTFLKNRVSRP
jgi:hypothetical protein